VAANHNPSRSSQAGVFQRGQQLLGFVHADLAVLDHAQDHQRSSSLTGSTGGSGGRAARAGRREKPGLERIAPEGEGEALALAAIRLAATRSAWRMARSAASRPVRGPFPSYEGSTRPGPESCSVSRSSSPSPFGQLDFQLEVDRHHVVLVLAHQPDFAAASNWTIAARAENDLVAVLALGYLRAGGVDHQIGAVGRPEAHAGPGRDAHTISPPRRSGIPRRERQPVLSTRSEPTCSTRQPPPTSRTYRSPPTLALVVSR
jgi:hypothetical protein